MKTIFFIPLLFFALAASAQHRPWADTLVRHRHIFDGHHGRDSARHATIENIFMLHVDSVKTFTTDGDETQYIDILRAAQGRGTVRYMLYLEVISPNGHTATDTKTINVFNPDGHNVITRRQENYAKQWGEEQLHGASWDARIPQGQGLIQVWITGVKNEKIVWRYLKVAE